MLANINQFIRTDFVYAARDAMGTLSPAQTLALRSGTCRDFALLMMEAVRGLGMDVSVRVRRRLPAVAGFQTQG